MKAIMMNGYGPKKLKCTKENLQNVLQCCSEMLDLPNMNLIEHPLPWNSYGESVEFFIPLKINSKDLLLFDGERLGLKLIANLLTINFHIGDNDELYRHYGLKKYKGNVCLYGVVSWISCGP